MSEIIVDDLMEIRPGQVNGAAPRAIEVEPLKVVEEASEAPEPEENIRFRMRKLSDELKRALARRHRAAELTVELAGNRSELESLERRAGTSQGKREEEDAPAMEEADTKGWHQRVSALPNSIIAAIVFGLAAIAFFAADFVVAREIVADALKMEGGWVLWLFAAGIAAIPVTLKPAYERLVEEPWHSKTSRWPFIVSILAASTLAVAALVVLGKFRHESLLTDLLVRNILSNPSEGAVDELGRLNLELMRHWAAGVAFPLLAAVFGVSGAVALTLATRNMRGFYHQRFSPGVSTVSGRLSTLAGRRGVQAEEKREAHLRRQIALAGAELETLPSLSDLDETIKRIEGERKEMADKVETASWRDRWFSPIQDREAQGSKNPGVPSGSVPRPTTGDSYADSSAGGDGSVGYARPAPRREYEILRAKIAKRHA